MTSLTRLGTSTSSIRLLQPTLLASFLLGPRPLQGELVHLPTFNITFHPGQAIRPAAACSDSKMSVASLQGKSKRKSGDYVGECTKVHHAYCLFSFALFSLSRTQELHIRRRATIRKPCSRFLFSTLRLCIQLDGERAAGAMACFRFLLLPSFFFLCFLAHRCAPTHPSSLSLSPRE